MRQKQEGMVLILALIILLLVSMLAITTSNVVLGNMKVVQNFEARNATRGAAMAGIRDAVANNGNFFNSTHTYQYENIDVFVSKPICLAAKPISYAAQDIVDQDLQQKVCFQPGQNALCSFGKWMVTSTAIDRITGAKYVFRQALRTTTETSLIASACGPSDYIDSVNEVLGGGEGVIEQ